jgi:hypothetical protein
MIVTTSAEEDQRQQTVAMRDHGANRRHHANQPDHTDGHVGRRQLDRSRAELQTTQQRQCAGNDRHDDQQRQVTLQLTILQGAGERAGTPDQQLGASSEEVAPTLHDPQRQLRQAIQADQPVQQHVQQQPAHQRDRRHQQRQVQPVPYRQLVGWQGATRPAKDRRLRRHCQRRTDRDAGHQTHHQAQHHQDLHGHTHEHRRFVRHLGQILRRAVEEHFIDEACRVSDAEHASQGRPERQQQLQRLGEEHLLREEAVEQRHAGHRRRGDIASVAVKGMYFSPVEPPDVARAGLVVDDAGRHEQRALEGGVVDDVEHAATRANCVRGRAAA